MKMFAINLWLLLLGIFITVVVVIGSFKKKDPWGLIIDDREKYSLSRLQALAWTLIIVSGYFAISFKKLEFIGIPDNLLLLMGVNLGSAVGSQVIKANKIKRNKIMTSTLAMTIGKTRPKPSFMDIFSEEEIDSEDLLSMGKFQMFCWTCIALAIYIAILITVLQGDLEGIIELPNVSSGIVWLMGASHGAYLLHKIPERK